ncbi:hypothetical protein H6G76_15870 [Nostoc sp. FACHB-152]|uniref:hypothetical protein n=1 Tax=unclassified Nostoc TaxID=2593658 RepID=UPI001689F618|nr:MULTISPECIES: hypothetical protein [unclassified Nostoc]MBD2448603.1 hypothetical protein [Nostoc sp. FACHB-152]MBD2469929.1 hypothetical protein [Nostoc sp. FACHB-145]
MNDQAPLRRGVEEETAATTAIDTSPALPTPHTLPPTPCAQRMTYSALEIT